MDSIELKKLTPHQPEQRWNKDSNREKNFEKAEVPNPLIYSIHPLIKGKVLWAYSWPRSKKISLSPYLHPVICHIQAHTLWSWQEKMRNILLSLITERTHSPLENISWFPWPPSINTLCLSWISWVSSSFPEFQIHEEVSVFWIYFILESWMDTRESWKRYFKILLLKL